MAHRFGEALPRHNYPCQYPDCTEIFSGGAGSKYCLEHKETVRLERASEAMKKRRANAALKRNT